MVYGVGRASKTWVKRLPNNKFPGLSSQVKSVTVQSSRIIGSGVEPPVVGSLRLICQNAIRPNPYLPQTSNLKRSAFLTERSDPAKRSSNPNI
jgi:hypothetical protein